MRFKLHQERRNQFNCSKNWCDLDYINDEIFVANPTKFISTAILSAHNRSKQTLAQGVLSFRSEDNSNNNNMGHINIREFFFSNIFLHTRTIYGNKWNILIKAMEFNSIFIAQAIIIRGGCVCVRVCFDNVGWKKTYIYVSQWVDDCMNKFHLQFGKKCCCFVGSKNETTFYWINIPCVVQRMRKNEGAMPLLQQMNKKLLLL